MTVKISGLSFIVPVYNESITVTEGLNRANVVSPLMEALAVDVRPDRS